MCFNKIYMYDIVELTVLIYLKQNTSRRADSNRPFATMMLLCTCGRIIQTALTKPKLGASRESVCSKELLAGCWSGKKLKGDVM